MSELFEILKDTAIGEMFTVGSISLIAVVIGVQKIIKEWKQGNAENSIISLMHNELSRLAEQNKKLAEELSKFQLEVVQLNKQVNALTVENSKLHSEVARLHETLIDREK